MTKLKPCPFCGCKAYCRNEYGMWVVECVNGFCDVMPNTIHFKTKAAATVAWNRRVQGEQTN